MEKKKNEGLKQILDVCIGIIGGMSVPVDQTETVAAPMFFVKQQLVKASAYVQAELIEGFDYGESKPETQPKTEQELESEMEVVEDVGDSESEEPKPTA